jgi:ribonuclease D
MPTAEYRFFDDPKAAGEALRSLAVEKEVAFDLEADSLHSYREKACLLQLSSSSKNIVIDPLSCGEALDGLAALFTDPGVRKIVHGGDYDIRLLKKSFGFGIRNVFDTMVAAQFTRRPKFGLAALLEEEFGILLDKKYQRADWSARPLPPELLSYAALDTAYLLPLKERLEKDLAGLGRTSWAEEEFRLREDVEPAPPKGPSALDVKGARRLSPQQRGRLQRLLEIRDRAARERDRPPFKVLSNTVLLSWVENPPAGRREVLEARGASKRALSLLATDILEAFSRPLSPGECPAPPAPVYEPLTGEQKKRLGQLKKARAAMEEALGLPPGLIVNSATLEALSRMEQEEALAYLESGLKEWQREVAGEELAKILRPDRG